VSAITRAGVRIEAQRVVMALGAWSSMPPLAAKGHVFQTYMMATPPLDARQLASLAEPGALVGTLDRGFTYRRIVDGRLLFGGLDESVKVPLPAGEVPVHVVPKLRSMLAAGIPPLSAVPIDQVWGGAFHVAGLSDVPSLTVWPRDPRVVVLAGSAGAGVLWCLIAGALVRGMIDARLDDGTDARFRAALQASRIPIGGALGLAARLALRAIRGR
jgi:glycine/D-amino acid oxidase-like deaminating enzyme